MRRVLIVLLAAFAVCVASASSAGIYTVPTTIAADCSTDVTSQLLRWIATVPDNSMLEFGTNACYQVDEPLDFTSRNGLDFEGNGATFRVMVPASDQDAVWRVWQSAGITFNAMTLQGSYTAPGTFNANLQHGHGFDLRGTNATITGVTISDVPGDCVYFGLGSDNTTRSSGSFTGSTCTGTSRNGVSVTAGNSILVQHDTVSQIGYETFDVEPNIASGNWGSNGVTFDANTIGSYYLYTYSVVENGPISNQSFTNNTLHGQGLHVSVGPVSSVVSRPKTVTVNGNRSDTAQAPVAMTFNSVDGLTVTGNTVPMTSGTMAQVTASCNVNVSGNSYPGGTSQVTIQPYRCKRKH